MIVHDYIEASERGVRRLHDDDGGGGGGVHRDDAESEQSLGGLWLLQVLQNHQLEVGHVTADQNCL